MITFQSQNAPALNAAALSDQALYERARTYGQNALQWRQKFIGLLPEVARRRLYEKKGFGSIFEFAAKLAGLSEAQVRTALNLERRFADLPQLKSLLETGEVSVHKLVRIQSIATTENEADLAQAVQLLPKTALETLVRDEKFATRAASTRATMQNLRVGATENGAGENENGLCKPKIGPKSLPRQMKDLPISEEVKARLRALQEKGLNLDELLTEFLDRREAEIAEEKAAIFQDLEEAKSRYVPARIRRIIREEHGSKCSIAGCQKPAKQLHHTQTFGLSRRHDPHFLAPLCTAHHLIAHSINVKVHERRQSARAC